MKCSCSPSHQCESERMKLTSVLSLSGVCVCVQGGADGRGVTAMVIYRCRDTADMMCFFVCVAVGAETASCQSHTVLQRQTVSPLLNT